MCKKLIAHFGFEQKAKKKGIRLLFLLIMTNKNEEVAKPSQTWFLEFITIFRLADQNG